MRERELPYQVLDLNGMRYAVLPERALRRLMREAGVEPAVPQKQPSGAEWDPGAWDVHAIAEHLVRRREEAGLTQADLARRAGVRVETLNRIERGRTNPDFATIRKLAAAIRKAEARLLR